MDLNDLELVLSWGLSSEYAFSCSLEFEIALASGIRIKCPFVR